MMYTLCGLSWSGRQFPLCRSSLLHEGLADRPFWLMSIRTIEQVFDGLERLRQALHNVFVLVLPLC